MLKIIRTFLSATPLLTLPAFATDGGFQTGITGVGPAKFMFALAGAMFLTLILRSSANHLTRIVTARLGQMRIRTALAKRSSNVLHDFILPGAYGGLAKVDHAILTAGGIICIQSKHYHGVVFGNEDEPQWTNIDSVNRRRFLNPLIQNEGRARALRNVVPDVPVANLVVFTGSVEFKSPLPKNVIHVDQIESYIAKFVFGPARIEDWDAVWYSVNEAAMTDENTRKDFQAQLGFS